MPFAPTRLSPQQRNDLLLHGAKASSFFHPLAIWSDVAGLPPEATRLRNACLALPSVPSSHTAEDNEFALTTPMEGVYLTVATKGHWLDHLGYAVTSGVNDGLFNEADDWFTKTRKRPLYAREPGLALRAEAHRALTAAITALHARCIAVPTHSAGETTDPAETARQSEFLRILRKETGPLTAPPDGAPHPHPSPAS